MRWAREIKVYIHNEMKKYGVWLYWVLELLTVRDCYLNHKHTCKLSRGCSNWDWFILCINRTCKAPNEANSSWLTQYEYLFNVATFRSKQTSTQNHLTVLRFSIISHSQSKWTQSKLTSVCLPACLSVCLSVYAISAANYHVKCYASMHMHQETNKNFKAFGKLTAREWWQFYSNSPLTDTRWNNAASFHVCTETEMKQNIYLKV